MALQYPATNFPQGGISAISPFALAAALLFASLLGWSGQAFARPPKAFTSGLPAVRSPLRLPDITTAPHWDLRRWDSHPQVQQLASLRPPKIPYGGFSPVRLQGRLFRRRLPDPPSAQACSRHTLQVNQFASALRAPRGGRLPALSVAVLRSVKHRHSSDLRRSTPGALAPVRVILSRSLNTYSAPCAPLAGTPRFRRTTVYTRCPRCAGALQRPASGSGLSLAVPSLSCRPLGPRGVHGRLSSSPPAAALAFAKRGTARHSQHLHHPLRVEARFRGFPVRFRYDLTGCSPPFGGSDQVQPQGRFMTQGSYALSMKCLRRHPRSPPSLRKLLRPGFQQIGHPHRCWVSLRQQLESSAGGTLTHWNNS